MKIAEFEAMVARLEQESDRAPSAYKMKVALLALLGFGLLALVLSAAGAGLLALVALAVALVTTGGGALILLLKLGKLLVVLALPLWFLVKSSLSALFVRLPAPRGHPVTRREAPQLFAALDDMRRRMKGPRFHQVLLVNEMNAAVVQRPLFGLIGFPRNYLLLGLPLLEAMSPDEALAVVAHEYGHLAGSHSRFSAFIYRLRLSWGTIQAITDQWSGWMARALRKPVNWYAPYFNAYTFVLARSNEYQADAASAELVGREAAVSALKRVNVSSPGYSRFLEQTFKTTRTEKSPPVDLSERWAQQALTPVVHEVGSKDLRDALAREPDVTDTHPSLRQRLKALGAEDHALEQLPGALPSASAAQQWLGAALAGLRREIQQRWNNDISTAWREQFKQWSEVRERVETLRGQETRTVPEQFELLRLSVQLLPDEDHLPAVQAFNAEQADHAPGLYLEGSLHLDRDDEHGLTLLERAMTLDADAIQPACERAVAFLAPRKDPRVESYTERWRQRTGWMEERQRQMDTLDPQAVVVPAELTQDLRDELRAMVAQIQPAPAKTWIARRVIPADPEAVCYVIVLQPTLWTRLRDRRSAMVQSALGLTCPVNGHFCTGAAPFKALAKRVRNVPRAQI